MSQMAVGATSIIKRALMVPVADDARGKDHQRKQREGYSEEANCLACRHFRKSVKPTVELGMPCALLTSEMLRNA
jgi:hypothetical protein